MAVTNVIVLLGTRNLQMEAVKVGCYYVCLFDGVLRHFQQYFSYIVAVSFIGGKNRRTRGKPLTCCKSLTKFIT